MCGMIDQYNAVEPPAGPPKLGYVISKQLRMQGSLSWNTWTDCPNSMSIWASGSPKEKLSGRKQFMEGIEKALQPLLGFSKEKTSARWWFGYKLAADRFSIKLNCQCAGSTQIQRLLDIGSG